MVIEIRKITFEQIFDVWSKKLWPGRNSKIEAVSAIDQNGLIDVDILNFTANFWGAFVADQLVGVVSTHPTEANVYRLRGLFVEESHRRLKIGKKLIQHSMNCVANENAKLLWTLARITNKEFYLGCGFSVTQEIGTYEFGPHYIMKKPATQNSQS